MSDDQFYDEQYTSWLSDNEDQLKKDFLMSFDQNTLAEFIFDYHEEVEDFFLVHEESYMDFCEERYGVYLETLGE